MWTLINILVGSKIARTVALVLAAGLILFTTIQYIQWQERDRVLEEIQKEDLKDYKDTRERIDETSPFDSVNDALEWLRNRKPD